MEKKIRIPLLFLAVLLPGIVSAQFALKKELHSPRAGDELIKQQVRYKDPGRPGENVVWDFSRLLPVHEGYSLVYSSPCPAGDTAYVVGLDTLPVAGIAEGELITGAEHYTLYYYRLSGNRLWTLGHENPTNLLQYTSPLLSAVYPLAYGERRRESYASRGIYSSAQAFSGGGDVEIHADAQGILLLPSGDTLKQVLRVKSVQTLREKDSLQRQTVLENYRWYAQGYRYPVFETVKTTVTTGSVETGRFETAFFYPPQDHYYLDNDEANLALREQSGSGRQPSYPQEGVSYNFYPNPVAGILHLELYLPQAAQVKLQVRTPGGFLLYSKDQGRFYPGMHRFRADLSALATGNYILTLFLDDDPKSGIIMKR